MTDNTPLAETLPDAIRRLRLRLTHARPAELKVIEYLENNARDIIRRSITEVAEGSQSSEATVVRVVKKAGFTGFQYFKIQLAQDLVSPVQSIHEEVAEGDDDGTILQKVFRANALALEDTLSTIRAEAFQQVIDLLESARRIELYGVGNSGLVAMDSYLRLMRLGLQVGADVAGHSQAVRASLLGAGDVVVGISHSGTSRDVIDALRIARERGARTVAITHAGKSPLTKLCHLSLQVTSRESAFRTEAMSSRIAMLTLMDAIFVALALRRHDVAAENILRIRKATADKRL